MQRLYRRGGTAIVNKTASILDRLAASIHGSDTPSDDPGIGACGTDGSWCLGDIPGSAFNVAWHSFNTWSQSRSTCRTA